MTAFRHLLPFRPVPIAYVPQSGWQLSGGKAVRRQSPRADVLWPWFSHKWFAACSANWWRIQSEEWGLLFLLRAG